MVVVAEAVMVVATAVMEAQAVALIVALLSKVRLPPVHRKVMTVAREAFTTVLVRISVAAVAALVLLVGTATLLVRLPPLEQAQQVTG